MANEFEVGGFRLLELISEGSMGRVYRAEQRQPQRIVALKIMKQVTGESAKRFAREIEFMAQLDHPGIAQVFAAGDAQWQAQQISYYAMEFIDGQDLIRHAQAEQASLNERLELLIAIANAVHYSHTHGVVHRDLKPSNILVTASGQPKILDFGIARLSSEGETAVTLAGQVLGTVPYMSPEQLSGEANQAGPLSDVYSLGVVAYQLLASQHPYPGLDQKTVLDALHVIRNDQPQRLRLAAPKLSRDLETVVMKAMAADPQQRYDSALGFAQDLQRIVNREPISARPPSFGYTLGLLMRRHRLATAAALLSAVGVVGGGATATYFAVQEARARAEAENRALELAAVNDFISEMLSSANPDNTKGEDLTVLQMVDLAYEQLRSDRERPERVRAELNFALATTYQSLGRSERALLLAQEAAALWTKALGSAAPKTISAQKYIAQTLTDLGRIEAAAEVLTRIPLEQLRFSPEGRYEARGIRLMRAVNHVERGQGQAAADLLQELVADDEAGDDEKVNIRYWLSKALDTSGDLVGATATAELVLQDCIRLFGPDGVPTQFARSGLARYYARLGRYEESERLHRAAVEAATKSQGEQHFSVAGKLQGLALLQLQAGKPGDALESVERATQIHLDHSGRGTREYLTDQYYRAWALGQLGNFAEAESLFAELLPQTPVILGPNHILNFDIRHTWARLRLRQNTLPPGELQALWEEAGAVLGSEHPTWAEIGHSLSAYQKAQGQPDTACATSLKVLPIFAKQLGEQHPLFQSARAICQADSF